MKILFLFSTSCPPGTFINSLGNCERCPDGMVCEPFYLPSNCPEGFFCKGGSVLQLVYYVQVVQNLQSLLINF